MPSNCLSLEMGVSQLRLQRREADDNQPQKRNGHTGIPKPDPFAGVAWLFPQSAVNRTTTANTEIRMPIPRVPIPHGEDHRYRVKGRPTDFVTCVVIDVSDEAGHQHGAQDYKTLVMPLASFGETHR